jgi:hypothetical protein
MKEISNISDLKKGKIYYIHVKTNRCPSIKLRGKYGGDGDENKEYIFMRDLEYINHHYDDLLFPYCKPILLRLWKANGKLYRFQSREMVDQIKEFPDLYEPCKIYEPENERILVNFMMRNKIINDPYFDYK